MENPIYARETLEFVAAAAEFCALLEQCGQRTEKELLDKLLKLLPLLYMKVQFLPDVETEGAFVPDGQVTEEDYDFVRLAVYGLLHEHDEYEMLVWDEDMQTEESRWCSLSEGLADIYQELKDLAAAFQTGEEPIMNDAVVICRQAFLDSWGRKLLAVLRALHEISDASYQ